MHLSTMRLILASRSEARRRTLDMLGLEYEIVPSRLDEKSIRHEDPEEMAKKLAEAKARDVGERSPDSIVIAGDLFVVFNGKIYEKPRSSRKPSGC